MKKILFIPILLMVFSFQNFAQNCKAIFAYEINNLEVSYIDLSSSNIEIIEWGWDFGNGQTSIEQNPVIQYTFPAIYQVCLKIITDDNCQYTYCKNIDIIDTTPTSECKASFDYEQEENKVQFYDNSWTELSTLTRFWTIDGEQFSEKEQPF